MLKKYGRFVPVVLGVSLLLCSCSAEGTPANNDYGESVPLSIQNLYLEGELATRTGGTPLTADGTTIGIFLTNAGGYTPMYKNTYVCSGGKWSSADPVCVDRRTGRAIGVYDPNSLVSFGTNSSVTANTLQAQPYDEAKLWYYDNASVTSVNNADATVAFSMKCAYSRLSFVISLNDNFPHACKVSRIIIKPTSGNFYTTANVDISDGALTGTAVANYTIDTSALPMNTTGLIAGAPDTSIDHLFPAQTLTPGAGLIFTLTTEGTDYSVAVPAATFNTIQRGMHYTVQIEMTGIGMDVSVTTDWNPTITGGTGTTADGQKHFDMSVE